MQMITLAIPSETSEGLVGKRSDHFGHCPVFTLVDIQDNQAGNIRSVDNIAHGAGGCMKPVGLLAENGVESLVVGGIGRGPFQRLHEQGIQVFFADLNQYPDVQATVDGYMGKKLPPLHPDQLCTSNGNCHH